MTCDDCGEEYPEENLVKQPLPSGIVARFCDHCAINHVGDMIAAQALRDIELRRGGHPLDSPPTSSRPALNDTAARFA